MKNPYDDRYYQENYYCGFKPSSTCLKALTLLPPEKPFRLFDIGCGEGRNTVFFARNGYEVTAFDLSPKGVEKTKALATKTRVTMEELRDEIMMNYMEHTTHFGLNAFSVFVSKPFIPKAPDAESIANHWKSRELFTYYHEWQIEYCAEEIFDCNSSGIPHRHAINRLSSNSPLLAARDEFEFGRIQLHRRVSRADVIPCSLLQGEFICKEGLKPTIGCCGLGSLTAEPKRYMVK